MSTEETKMVHSNLEMKEIIPLAALAYPAYRAFVIHNDVKVGAAVVAAGAIMLNVAGGSDKFMGSGSEGEFAISNFGMTEMVTIAALGYAAYQFVKVYNDVPAAACLAGGAFIGLTQGGKSKRVF